MSIEIVVNGEPRAVPANQRLPDLLRFLDVDPSRVALELNRGIVRKSAWADTIVEAGAHLEIVQFVGGG
jgi:thiamine biosynthesis protein ThiS